MHRTPLLLLVGSLLSFGLVVGACTKQAASPTVRPDGGPPRDAAIVAVDAATPVCTGTALPCEGRSQAACGDTCVWTQCASAGPRSCDDLFCSFDGCTRDFDGNCVGTPTPCTQLGGGRVCQMNGCMVTPTETCVGTVAPCATLSAAECPAHAGCRLVMDDGGVAVADAGTDAGTPHDAGTDTGTDTGPTCPAETCNGGDEDCDGRVDEGIGHVIWSVAQPDLAGGALHVLPDGEGWIVIASLPDHSVVARHIASDGTLDALSPVASASDPTRATNAPIHAAADATQVYLAWLSPSTLGYSDLLALRAARPTLHFVGGPLDSSLRRAGSRDVDVTVADGLVLFALAAPEGLFLRRADSNFRNQAGDTLTSETNAFGPILSPRAAGGFYVSWTRSGMSWLTRFRTDVLLSSGGMVESVTARLALSPQLVQEVELTGARDEILMLSSDSTSTYLQSATQTVDATAHSSFAADTAPMSVGAICEVGIASLGSDAVMVTLAASSSAGTSTLTLQHVSASVAPGAPEIVDAPAANGCIVSAVAGAGGRVLITVTRAGGPISFLWGC